MNRTVSYDKFRDLTGPYIGQSENISQTEELIN